MVWLVFMFIYFLLLVSVGALGKNFGDRVGLSLLALCSLRCGFALPPPKNDEVNVMNIKKTRIACAFAFVAASSSPAFAAVTATTTASGDFNVSSTSTVSMVINPLSTITAAGASVAHTDLGSFSVTGNGELAVRYDASMQLTGDNACATLKGVSNPNNLFNICLGKIQGVYGGFQVIDQDGQSYLHIGSASMSAPETVTAYFVSNQHGASVTPDSYKVTLNAISYIN